jgi:PAS domain S-box-containing protein
MKRILHFLAPPVFADDEEKTRTAYLLNVITISSFLAALIYGLIVPVERVLYAGLAIGVTLIVWLIMKRGHLWAASITLVISISIVVAVTVITAGGVDASEYGAFVVPILFSGLLLGWKATAALAMASTLFGAVLIQADLLSLLPEPVRYEPAIIWIINSVYFILSGVFLALALQLINQTLANARRELTERKQVEDDLLQFRKVMDEISEAMFMSDPQTSHYIGFNKSAYEFLGYSRDELSRLGVIHIAPHVTSMEVWQEQVELVRDKGGLIFESFYRRKDGTTFPVEISARMLNSGGKTIMLELVRDITDRKRAEEALHESDARLRRLLETAIDAFISIDSQGVITEWNPQAALIFGWSREEAVGRKVADLIIPEIHRDDHQRGLEHYLTTGEGPLFSRRVEINGLHRNGQLFPIELSINSVPTKGGITFSAFVRDISERKQAEETLRESEEHFRKVFHSSPVAICITALEDGRLLEANYAYWDLTGYDPETSIGMNAEELKMWDAPEERKEFVQNLRARRSLFDPDDIFYHTDGSIRFVISFYELIQIKQEDCILAMFYDMSAQKRTVQALQQSEARTRALLEAIPDLIFEISSDGTFLKSIQQSVTSLMIAPDQFLGRKIGDVMPESVAERSMSAIQRALSTGKLESFEYQLQMDDSIHDYEARIAASGKDTVLAIVRDITQRKWAETEREVFIAELEARNRESETLGNSLASIVTTFDLQELVERILDQIKLVIPYDTASVWRVDEEWQTLLVSRDLPPEISLPELKFRIDTDNSSRPLLHGEKPFVLNNNVQEEFTDFQGPHSYINSWLAVPLKKRDKIIGLIALDGRKKGQFTEHHAELAATFANQVAIALENADLFNELQNELAMRENLIKELEQKNAEAETLRESLASIVGTLEVQEIVHRVLYQIRQVIPYDTASVWKFEGRQQLIIAGVDLPPEIQVPGTVLEVDEDNSAYPILHGQAPYILNNNVQEELKDFKAPHNFVQSWLAIPLKTRGLIIGLIALDGKSKNQFTEHHAELAVTFANQVAIALENARLFSELQSELEQRRRLIAELEIKNIESETLRESAAIITATLEKDEAIDSILKQLERVIPYDSASVQLVIGKMLVIVSVRGYPIGDNSEDNQYEINENEPAYPVLCGDLPYALFDDVQPQIPAFAEPPHNRIHAWMAVPLKVKGQIIGIIALDGYQAGKFSKHHAQLAVTFADQVAIAMENARLFTDLQTELKKQIALRSASMAISSSLHLDQVLNEICKQMCVVNNGTSAYISQYDNAYSYYTVKADYMGVDANVNELVSDLGLIYYKKDGAYIFDETKGLDFEVVHSDDENLLPWTRDILSKYGGKSILYIPLYVQGRLLGHAELWDSRGRHEFTRDEISFCRVLCQQAAIAIANASLFEQLQKELIERKDLIAELENKNAELERFTYTVSHDLKSPLFTIRGFLGYLEQDALSGNLGRVKADIQRITDATEKMQNLLNDLLELSRIGRLQNTSVRIPFEELAHEAVELVQGRIMERDVTIQINANLPAVFGDRPRLLEVLQNLIDNAAKFMGTQKEPRIEIGQIGEDAEHGMPIFYVSDNGIGISTEHFERVFGLFNKLDVKSDGTGIGLALVKRIVEVHGGRIWVESEVAKGTTFYFTLPPASR